MIRFATIGTSRITELFLESAKRIPDFSLTAVYSRSEEKAKPFASKHGATYTFTTIEELGACEEVDAVYIASPNAFHAEQAIALMNSGKHILVEKPMASNAMEVKAMIDAAKKNGVVLMEAMKSTVMPNFVELQNHLHKIGKIRRYFASYCQYSSRYDKYKEGIVLNAFKPELSNGSLMDIGVYCIYPMVVLFGKPLSVQASSIKLESGVDGEGVITCQYEDMDAVIMYSKITNSYIPSEIQGEEGSLIIDQIHTPTHIEVRYRDNRTETISSPPEHPTMYYETKEFIDIIQSGKHQSTNNSLHHSLVTMEIMDEVRKQTGIVFPADKK
ncbi:Gfo/Idh/MocA family protein [Bacillus kexueae]|uniref:Gfo/Idh/MocA family protein n=1 Tax=Aeribacillus kexueae TaxID=2078952 RepID=UPI001FAFD2FE|nr:Gfo/Idh/MocA family oxidoreductase [Bacillus kexueae]